MSAFEGGDLGRLRIHPSAAIGAGNEFGNGVTIGPDVVIGEGNRFADGVVVVRSARIGSNNYFGHGVVIGVDPTNSQTRPELNRAPPNGLVTIGSGTVIREFTVVDLPTGAATSIGNDCYIMQHNEIAHDVVIEDGAILSNHCSPGGSAVIMAGANLGKGVQVHQRNVIGQYAMIGVGTVVVRNVLPAATVAGNPARFLGINSIGLERSGFSETDIASLDAVLSGGGDAGETPSDFSTAVRSVLSDFRSMVELARDDRTVPSVDIRQLLDA
jgi:UDP-N-acetylglucosamine acyltransferase